MTAPKRSPLGAAPKRRWFRFGLRTLFVVVTVFCLFLGGTAYNLNWIRQRHAALSSGRFSGVAYKKADSVRALGLLWLVGEPSYSGIVIHLREREPLVATPVKESELIAVCKLFPEVRQNYVQWIPPSEPDPAPH